MTFNPDEFMNQTVDAPLETEYKIVPEGEYTNAFIDDFKAENAFNLIEGKSDKTGKDYSFLKASVPFKINDPKALQETGRTDYALVYKEFNVDRDESGRIAVGPNKNVELGRLYDAAGLNSNGASFGQLRGTGPFVIRVVHESGKRKDGSEWKQARVAKVTRQV